MTCSPADSTTQVDGGYTTAVFAGLTFMMAMVASAGLLLARQHLLAAEREVSALKERSEFEGRAEAATLKLMEEDGTPTLRWSEAGTSGEITVTLEPEGLKIAPDQLARLANSDLISGLVGASTAAAVTTNAAGLKPAADGAIHRWQLAWLNSDPRWRECATTVVSPYTRLTALALQAPSAPGAGGRVGGPNRRPGELWRVTVDGADGAWLDRVVRMTGASNNPVATVDDAFGKTPGNGRLSCLTDLTRVSGRLL